MCDPVTAAITATAIGGGVQAYGEYQKGSAENKYYQYAANQNEKQAQIVRARAHEQSKIENRAGSEKLKEQKINAAKLSSSQRAAMVANGISLDSKTAEDITNDSFTQEQLDEQAIKYNADSRVWEIREKAKYDSYGLLSQAEQYRTAGRNAKQAGKIGAFTTLLSTAASVSAMNFKGTNAISKGKNLGPGTTSYGVNVPSRYRI